MSWSVNEKGSPDQLAEKLDNNQYLPEPIKEYIGDGIEALIKRHGEDVVVTISGSGHLHNGEEGNWDSTTANLTVSKATE